MHVIRHAFQETRGRDSGDRSLFTAHYRMIVGTKCNETYNRIELEGRNGDIKTKSHFSFVHHVEPFPSAPGHRIYGLGFQAAWSV